MLPTLTFVAALLPLTLAQYGYDSPAPTSSAAATPSSAAKGVHIVEVGVGGVLKFSPDSLTVPSGDSVEFRFSPMNHSVAQSSFQAPCTPSGNTALFSGFRPVSSGVGTDSWTLKINDTSKAIWLYCAQAKHCQSGMSMVINPPSDKNISAYQTAAKNVSANVAPAIIQGGVIGPLSSSSSSPSSSGSAATPKPSSGVGVKGVVIGGAGQFVLAMGVLTAMLMLDLQKGFLALQRREKEVSIERSILGMHDARTFAVPVVLLLFTIASKTVAARYEPAGQYGWPYNLPVDAKFWPEDGPFRRRDLEGLNAEPARKPIGVRKMNGDEGEKFYTDYWMFAGPEKVGGERPMLQPLESKRDLRPSDEDEDEALQLHNSTSTPHPFKAPILLHTNDYQNPLYRRSPRAALLALQNRDFKCPGGTTDCSSIGRPNSCCGSGEVCQIIPKTGLGDVGCCPVGKGCSGGLENCDSGFMKCSDDLGGGCCIPDYICVGAGCGPGPNLISLIIVTPTVTQLPSITPSSSTPPPSPASTGPRTTVICPTAFKACPASLSGGCCRTDRICGATDCPASPGSSSLTSPSTVAAPVRPTTGVTYNSILTASGCPVGYYQCNAYYRGNCCRAGRDCGFTDCPAIGGSTVVNTNGITIVAGNSYGSNGVATAAVTSSSPNNRPGSCASGWYSCDASLSGGCCPSGFGCSVASCVASTGATTSVGKIAPSGAVELRPGFGWMVGVVVLGVAGMMVWL
ncbi:MAG: hypothetical protein M1839_009559 [Geoglossum umbratile]|nr:MAG: hypothetical protein M1839_009559 [Geoglossum umbratile]